MEIEPLYLVNNRLIQHVSVLKLCQLGAVPDGRVRVNALRSVLVGFSLGLTHWSSVLLKKDSDLEQEFPLAESPQAERS